MNYYHKSIGDFGNDQTKRDNIQGRMFLEYMLLALTGNDISGYDYQTKRNGRWEYACSLSGKSNN